MLSDPSVICPIFQSLGDTTVDYNKRRSIIYTMATCHALRVVNGELLGDPLDIKMFQFTGWSYEEGGSHNSDQPNGKHDTLKPSVARPPVAGAYLSDSDSRVREVSALFRLNLRLHFLRLPFT